MRITISTCVFLAVIVSSAMRVEAQIGTPLPRYQPPLPTTSPYLLLLRAQTGPLPNFHAFVQPAQLQHDLNVQQTLTIQRLQIGVQVIEQAATGQISATGIRSTGTLSTGGGAVSPFRNYSHYYRNYSHYYPGAQP